jgi:tripartite motif-containing protein 71
VDGSPGSQLTLARGLQRTRGIPDLNGTASLHPRLRLPTSAILLIMPLCLANCGASASPTAVASTPGLHVPTGQGTTWQVVATADGFLGGLAFDGHGHVYAADGTNRIVEFSVQGSVVTEWGVEGSAPGQLNQPGGVALGGLGDVYVTDNGNNRVEKFSATGVPIAQWGQQGSLPGDFNFPIGIALDGKGNVYVADVGNYRVQKLSPSGTPVAWWGSEGPAAGQFVGHPARLAVGADGNVYVSEAYGSNLVHEFSPAGVFIARWGGTGSDPGKFNEPRGLALDSRGNVFIDDIGNNRIQELSPSGQFVAEWKGPSTAPFPEQSDIALDGNGNLYVSDGTSILRTCVMPGGCI